VLATRCGGARSRSERQSRVAQASGHCGTTYNGLLNEVFKTRRNMMRYIYIALIILITIVVVTFKVQNIEIVTVSFLKVSLTLPLSLLILGVYFLGMFTGGAVISLIRSLIARSKKPTT
jgi:uncharacterized integral membrane protein